MDLLKDLNDEQRRAVERTDGAVLVLAGAGSGKTRVLVHRIAHTLARGLAAPDEIVAVTFTNKAAGEMRERVGRLLGPGAAPARVGTFHALCLRMLRREAPRLGYRDGFEVFDTDDSLRLLRECLKEAGCDPSAVTASELLRRISAAKNQGVGPEEAEGRWAGPLAGACARAYQAYASGLRKMNAMDFDDLILNVLDLFADHPERRALWAGACRYLLVDEYQDTNPPQFRLVKDLSSAHGNVCAVGDEDQAIYRFRGADIGNILSFQQEFPGAAVVKLTRNYRSTGAILEAANALVSRNRRRIGKDLWTDAGTGGPVRLTLLPGDREEAAFVLGRLRELRGGVPLEEVAVLYRTNAQSRLFEEALIGAGVPYRIWGSLRFYDRKEIRDLLAYLKVALNPVDDVSFRRVVNVPSRGLGAAALAAVEEEAVRGGTCLRDAMRAALERGTLPARAAAPARAFLQVLDAVRAAAPSATPAAIVRDLVAGLDYEEHLRRTEGPDAQARMENVEQLIAAAEEAAEEGLQGFLDRASLVSDAESAQGDRGVNLMTLHAAKGLEFDVVFLAGMEEGLLPHLRSQDSEEEVEEERRLCYVGMTRARRSLHLTAAASRRTYEGVGRTELSRFLEEIGPDRLERSFARASVPGGFQRRRGEVPLGEEDVSVHPSDGEDGAGGADDEDHTFAVGAKVRHEQFGVGEILNVEPAAEGHKLTVRFAHARTMKILTRFARLTPVRR